MMTLAAVLAEIGQGQDHDVFLEFAVLGGDPHGELGHFHIAFQGEVHIGQDAPGPGFQVEFL